MVGPVQAVTTSTTRAGWPRWAGTGLGGYGPGDRGLDFTSREWYYYTHGPSSIHRQRR